ncbi:protein FAM124B [Takifugu flavidus]|nr:protein FAM124B [Takifugu flavidus]
MFPGAALLKRSEDEYPDSGAETAGSDCSRMPSSGSELRTRQTMQQEKQQPHRMHLHLLANPGDSLLLQHTLDHLIRWLYPSLRIFHVSERASSFRTSARACPTAGYPSLAITLFLHEVYGEERILKALDYFQHPPWQYHHTESCGRQPGGIPLTSGSSLNAALIRPYLLPSRDFYSLGAGMPVWGVRPVHCGGEILRLTLYSGYDNYEDAVHFYETVLQRQAEEQKTGFCWFTLHCEPGLCMQLALKQLSPGVRAKPCNSAVLQFRVEEIGQLVPLLPNPCSPISNTRWQTEDLDGNKVLFQVKPPAQPERPLTCAFPLTCPSTSSAGTQHRSSGQGHVFSPRSLAAHGQGVHVPHAEPLLDTFPGAAASLESGSCSSIPSGSSSYSSQNSSPSPFSTTSTNTNSLLRPSITRSFSHLLLEEAEEETNVDTGVPASVQSIARSASTELLLAPSSESPKAVGPPFTGGLSKVLMECLPQIQIDLQGSARKCPKVATRGKERPTEGPGHGACTESRTMAELLSARMYRYESVDEFFI